jgi:glycerate dehydrogenase
MIAVAGTGYGQIDLAACPERGIVVSNLRGWCDCSFSAYVFALAPALRRHLSEHTQTAGDTTWHRSTTGALHCTHSARDLCGDTMGIIGFGNIGQRVAGLAKAFGMKVLAAERKGSASIRSGRIEFSRVLEQSYIVSLHCTVTDETRYLIGEDELRSMKRDAILINCAQGELLDNAAFPCVDRGNYRGRWIGRCGGGNPCKSVAELASPQP